MKVEFPSSFSHSWLVRKDLDEFFGVMVDNLIQLILIVSLCRELILLPDSFIFGRILPGTAVSLLGGNFYYSWHARRLARESGREDVTALPYGVNVPNSPCGVVVHYSTGAVPQSRGSAVSSPSNGRKSVVRGSRERSRL